MKYYVGSTANLEDRILRHNSGRSGYTKQGMPWELIKVITFESRNEAVKVELSIKKRGIDRYLQQNIRGVAQSG